MQILHERLENLRVCDANCFQLMSLETYFAFFQLSCKTFARPNRIQTLVLFVAANNQLMDHNRFLLL